MNPFSRFYEICQFIRGMGNAEFLENAIRISGYPFEPSTVYPEKLIRAEDIDAIHPDTCPPTIRLKNELIFVSGEKVDALKNFADAHALKITARASNWDYITEPFLDTEFDEMQQKATMEVLAKNGISPEETNRLRAAIEGRMYKYNFDTMLWEWVNLGLLDVLLAMRPAMDKNAFRAFYWQAMEIEQRVK